MPPTELIVDNAPYLHVKEAARIAHVVPDYMARLCRKGVVWGRQIRGIWHVQEDSLNAFLHDRVERKEALRHALAQRRKEEQRQAGYRARVAQPPHIVIRRNPSPAVG